MPVAPLYDLNFSQTGDFSQFASGMARGICLDVDNSATCGGWIFGDAAIMILFLAFFIGFKQKSSFKDSYAGASVITFTLAVILFLWDQQVMRSSELLMVMANLFISVVMLYILKDER